MKMPTVTMISLVVLGLASCTSYQQQGALVGGLVGAVAGALLGDDHQDVIAGAAVGAGVGAAGAAVHENEMRRRNADYYGNPTPRQYQEPGQSAPQPEPQPQDYPTAQRTTTPGEVLSPYPPNNRIDVSGFRSGQLVKDPKTGQIFRVP
jgi:hypothetical protein